MRFGSSCKSSWVRKRNRSELRSSQQRACGLVSEIHPFVHRISESHNAVVKCKTTEGVS